jgi:hypothetical protein
MSDKYHKISFDTSFVNSPNINEWKQDNNELYELLVLYIKSTDVKISNYNNNLFDDVLHKSLYNDIVNDFRAIDTSLNTLIGSLKSTFSNIPVNDELVVLNHKKEYDDKIKNIIGSISNLINKFDKVKSTWNYTDDKTNSPDNNDMLLMEELEHDSREEDIQEIARNMEQLNQMFRDLSYLVKDQGTILDNIEINVCKTVDATADAEVELKSANKYQKASKRLCIIALIVLVTILVGLILFAVFTAIYI